jgi:hypothetical protein
VLDLSRFGNVQLNVRHSHLAAAGLGSVDRILVEAQFGGALAKAGLDVRRPRCRSGGAS